MDLILTTFQIIFSGMGIFAFIYIWFLKDEISKLKEVILIILESNEERTKLLGKMTDAIALLMHKDVKESDTEKVDSEN